MNKVPYLLSMLTGISLAQAGPLGVFLLMVPESACVPVARFAVLTTLGCAIWASAFVLAGMLLGAGWQEAGHALRIPVLLTGAAACGALVLRARRRKP